ASQISSVGEKVTDRLHGAVDVVVRMRKRKEHRLELRGSHVDAVRKQVTEERAVAFRVARLDVVEVANAAVGHEGREHGADTADQAELPQPRLEPGALPLELLVEGFVAQAAQHAKARGGRERVPGKRARLIDGPDRCK